MAPRKKPVLEPEQVTVPQEVKIEKPVTYTKAQLVDSAKYRNRKDLINAVLVDGKTYTIEEVEQRVEQFMRGTVK